MEFTLGFLSIFTPGIDQGIFNETFLNQHKINKNYFEPEKKKKEFLSKVLFFKKMFNV